MDAIAVLIAMGVIPVTRVIVPFVSGAYGGAVPGERPQFLEEPVVQLHLRESKANDSFRPLTNSERFLHRGSTYQGRRLICYGILCSWSTSHRENDAKLCLAAHHARVSFGRFFERVCLDHGTHAAQFGETQCVLGVGCRSSSPALNRSTSSNELYRRDLNGIESRTYSNKFAVRSQTVDQLGHRFRAWGCRQNYPCAAHLLQGLHCVRRFAVDVYARPELPCQRRVFRPPPDRRHLITKLVRELNSQMTQTADTLHRNKVAGESTAVPQRVVGGNSGAEQRCRVGVTESFRYRRQCLNRSHHVLLVSAVIADARNFQIPAIAKVSAPALATRVVLAAVPADTDALPLLPGGNTRAYFIDDACNFVSRNTGILDSWPSAFFREH